MQQTLVSTQVNLAVSLLQNNQVVALPTETVYGLGGNALNEEVVQQIYAIKNRPLYNPLIVHVASVSEVEKYAQHIPNQAYHLLQAFAPGPITLLLPKKSIIPSITTSGKPQVAIRIPAHPFMQQVLQQLSFPIAAPSANPFGYISPTTPQHVLQQLQGKIPMILDGGACEQGLESTVVGFNEQQTPVIYRQGMITLEQIQQLYPDAYLLANPTASDSPGNTPFHYSPNTPLYLIQNIADIPNNINYNTTGIITLQPITPTMAKHQVPLSETGDLYEAAQNLYSVLHQLDAIGLEKIFIQTMPQTGIGKTINERIKKAAAKF